MSLSSGETEKGVQDLEQATENVLENLSRRNCLLSLAMTRVRYDPDSYLSTSNPRITSANKLSKPPSKNRRKQSDSSSCSSKDSFLKNLELEDENRWLKHDNKDYLQASGADIDPFECQDVSVSDNEINNVINISENGLKSSENFPKLIIKKSEKSAVCQKFEKKPMKTGKIVKKNIPFAKNKRKKTSSAESERLTDLIEKAGRLRKVNEDLQSTLHNVRIKLCRSQQTEGKAISRVNGLQEIIRIQKHQLLNLQRQVNDNDPYRGCGRPRTKRCCKELDFFRRELASKESQLAHAESQLALKESQLAHTESQLALKERELLNVNDKDSYKCCGRSEYRACLKELKLLRIELTKKEIQLARKERDLVRLERSLVTKDNVGSPYVYPKSKDEKFMSGVENANDVLSSEEEEIPLDTAKNRRHQTNKRVPKTFKYPTSALDCEGESPRQKDTGSGQFRAKKKNNVSTIVRQTSPPMLSDSHLKDIELSSGNSTETISLKKVTPKQSNRLEHRPPRFHFDQEWKSEPRQNHFPKKLSSPAVEKKVHDIPRSTAGLTKYQRLQHYEKKYCQKVTQA